MTLAEVGREAVDRVLPSCVESAAADCERNELELRARNPLEHLDRAGLQNVAFGETVLGSGTWKITIPVEKSSPQVMEGRYSDVKALRDGKWVYVMDHASVPLPPPPAPVNK